MRKVAHGELLGELGDQKGAILASRGRLAGELAAALGDAAGQKARPATSLGVDFAAGGRRRCHGAESKRWTRIANAGGRARRAARLRAAVGRRASKL